MTNSDPPKNGAFRINMNLIYQILAILALAATGFSEFIRMGDRVSQTEKRLDDIALTAARIPTVEQRLISLESDTIRRSGPLVDEVSILNTKIVRLEQIVLVERPNILSAMQKEMDAIEIRLVERAKEQQDIERDLYQVELRRNGDSHPAKEQPDWQDYKR